MNYWYKDNWTGNIKEFATLRAAKASAKQECGMVIYVNKGRETVCIVKASEVIYP